MKIINKTKYPTSQLRKLVEFARPEKIKRKSVTIIFHWRKDHDQCSGSWYASKNKIMICMPKIFRESSWPKMRAGEGNDSENKFRKRVIGIGYVPHIRLDIEEDLIHVLAHEMRHEEQTKRPKLHMLVYGTVNFSSRIERDADAHAIRKQREWRKLQKPIIRHDPIMTECNVYFTNKN